MTAKIPGALLEPTPSIAVPDVVLQGELGQGPLTINETSDPRGLAVTLHSFEQTIGDVSQLPTDIAQGKIFALSNDVILALQSEMRHLSTDTLLQLTDRLASVLPGQEIGLSQEQRRSIGYAIGSILNSYNFMVPIYDISVPSLLKLTELSVATHNSAMLGVLADAVYHRCHNDIFGPNAPGFIRDRSFTRALVTQSRLRISNVNGTEDPRALMLEGRKVARATELHLMAYGFSAEEATSLTLLWGTMQATEPSERNYLRGRLDDNIARIEALERQQPGLSVRLFQERGIAHFGRYPQAMLLQQFEPLPNHAKPDFMVLPHTDHNGAFNFTLEAMEMSLDKEDLARFRIAEVDSPEELARLAQLLKDEFGPAQNMIIGGHGTTESIQFGPEYVSRRRPETMLHIDQVETQIEGLEQCIQPGGVLILVSCSTGAEMAIGQKIAQALQRSTQAPTIPANIKRVTRTKNGRLIVEFDHNAGRTLALAA